MVVVSSAESAVTRGTAGVSVLLVRCWMVLTHASITRWLFCFMVVCMGCPIRPASGGLTRHSADRPPFGEFVSNEPQTTRGGLEDRTGPPKIFEKISATPKTPKAPWAKRQF